jgi:hypothetical protein
MPFDHHFDMNTEDELNCSELVYDVLFKALNKAFSPINQRVEVDIIKFSNFFNDRNFKTLFELKPYSSKLK